jgi:hypothetical protein
MEGHAVDTPEHPTPTASAGAGAASWRDLGLIALLLLLALGLRGWLLAHTEVPARDTIGFIRYALEFEADPWPTVLRNNHQHPGYPLTVLAVSVPVRAATDPDEMPPSEVMSLSAQLASNLAAVLLVIPMFYLGKLLFHRAAGFGAAALFQCLPVSGHILSDGLSEALFLLMATSALALAVLATASRRPAHFAWCGLFCGLAYLTRPEGALLLAATAGVLLVLPWLTGRPLPLRRGLECGACLIVVAVAVGAPYFLAVGRFTNKPSGHQIFGNPIPELEQQPIHAPPPPPKAVALPTPRPLVASALAFVLRLDEPIYRRTLKAIWGLGGELVKCFHYVAWLPVVLGMWWYRKRMALVPGMWVVLAACALQAAALTFLAVKVGYLSDRHLLLLVMCGCCTAAAAAWELPRRLADWLHRRPWSGAAGGPAALLLLPGLLAAGMPKTLDTLHGNRAGYHLAGLWLSKNATAYDDIDDDHCWAHYYSGRVLQERTPPVLPAGYRPVRYVVLGRRDREIIPTWNRVGQPDEDGLRAEGAVIVYHWPANCTPADASVVVYRRP